jgi:methylase of polypeptide subunit release factors
VLKGNSVKRSRWPVWRKTASIKQEKSDKSQFNSLEMCAGAGEQALGLEMAGFDHVALVELEPTACTTLRLNRPAWNVIEDDLRRFDGRPYRAGGRRRAMPAVLQSRETARREG